MIVVRANLYSGRPERARQRSAKARLTAAAVVLVCALLIFDFSQSRALASLRGQRAAAERFAAQVAGDVETAKTRNVDIQEKTARRDAVLNFAARRRNWAPVLAGAIAAVPATVELSTLQIEATDPGKPRVRIAGKCAGTEPRIEADKCMLQITHAFASAGVPMTGRFLTLEDTQPGLIGAENRPGVAQFVMQFTREEGAHGN